MTKGTSQTSEQTSEKPIALVVLLENVGHVVGITLPQWAMNTIDYVTEEYAKVQLRLFGAYRKYDRVIILEDQKANGKTLSQTLLSTSQTHQVDLILLVHGHKEILVGYKGREYIGNETWNPLCETYEADSSSLDLRMVFGINCYGESLATVWQRMGAKACNGAVGVNWFPEPTLSVFLRNWLRGKPYGAAVRHSNVSANKTWKRILGSEYHQWILDSTQIVFGEAQMKITGIQ